MPVVVSDTSPINYLVQINAVDLLPKLFGKINISQDVHEELAHSRTPAVVRSWITSGAPWLEIMADLDPGRTNSMPLSLDEGERSTIALAGVIAADLILMDDRDGVAFARAQGFAVTGTLGVLDLAARGGLIDLVQAFAQLKATTFHYRQGLLDALLAQSAERKK